jgi:hypothetical protein
MTARLTRRGTLLLAATGNPYQASCASTRAERHNGRP